LNVIIEDESEEEVDDSKEIQVGYVIVFENSTPVLTGVD